MKKRFVFVLMWLVCFTTYAQTKQPNIVFIVADDLGYGDLACYGHLIAKTPHIDKLAKQGLKLTHYYSPSPLCSPSRAAMLTGRTPYRLGIQSWIPEGQEIYLRGHEITLANLLNEHGYQSFMAGKWHLNGGLGETKHTQPQDAGFSKWFALHAFPLPNNKNPTNFYENGQPLGELKGFGGEFAVNKAIQYVEERDKTKPFFLYFPMVEVHSEIASPDKYLDMYRKYMHGAVQLKPLKDNGPGEYYANITFMDDLVGRLLQKLKDEGLEDNTIVIFTSDNGPVTSQWRKPYEINLYGSSGGLRGRKADLYDGGLRVPAIIKYPKHIQPNTVSTEPAHGYDWFTTICGLLNIEVPTGRIIDGCDLSPLFDNKKPERTNPLFWAFETRSADDPEGYYYAARDGDWKIITDEKVEKTLLYNLKTDPFEVVEVSKKNPEVTRKLTDYIKKMKLSIENDPLRPRIGS